jgi:hypothetical protein
MEDKFTEATQVEALKKMRDAMTFETAWTYENKYWIVSESSGTVV